MRKILSVAITFMLLLSSIFSTYPVYAADSQNSTGYDVVSVIASSDDGNVPENTRDGVMDTRWAGKGDGQFIQYDLGESKSIGYLGISFYQGDTRKTSFDIQVSDDATNWTKVYSGSNSSLSLVLEVFDFEDVTARYVQIVGHCYVSTVGGKSGEWNSITEVQIFPGNGTSTPVVGGLAKADPYKIVEGTASSSGQPSSPCTPQDAFDGTIEKYWAGKGDGEWLQLDLGETKPIGYIAIAHHQGDTRIAKFEVMVSEDASNWTTVYTGASSGTTIGLEAVDFDDVNARYVKIVGHKYVMNVGGKTGDWNSFAEVQIYPTNADGTLALGSVKMPAKEKSVEVKYTKPGFVNPDGSAHEPHLYNIVIGSTLNVKDYGADPANKENDDTKALQAAIADASAGDEVFLPNGVYLIKKPLLLKTYVNLRGESKDGVVILMDAKTANTTVIKVESQFNVMISDLTVSSTFEGKYSDNHVVNNPEAYGPNYGIQIEDNGTKVPSYNITVDNVIVEKFQQIGVRVAKSHNVVVKNSTFRNASDVGGGGAGYGIDFQGEGNNKDRLGFPNDSRYNLAENNTFVGPYIRHGVLLQYYSHNNVVRNNTFDNTRLDSIDLHGEDEYLNDIYGNTVTNTTTGAGIAAGNSGATHDKSGPGNYIHDNTIINCREGVKVATGTENTVIENNIIKNSTVNGNGIGIYVLNAPNTIVKNNQIIDNTGKDFTGILLSYDVGVSNDFGSSEGKGSPKNITITGNVIKNNTYGIKLEDGTDIIVEKNDVSGNAAGDMVDTRGQNVAVRPGDSDGDSAEKIPVATEPSTTTPATETPKTETPKTETPAIPEGGTLVLATDDTYVDAALGTANYGTGVKMLAKKSADGKVNRLAYMKFNKSDIKSDATAIYLKIAAKFGTITDASQNEQDLYVYGIVDDSWTEKELTWDNAPSKAPKDVANGEVLVGKIHFINTPGETLDYVLDITDYIKNNQDDIISLVIADDDNEGVNMNLNPKEYTKEAQRSGLIVK